MDILILTQLLIPPYLHRLIFPPSALVEDLQIDVVQNPTLLEEEVQDTTLIEEEMQNVSMPEYSIVLCVFVCGHDHILGGREKSLVIEYPILSLFRIIVFLQKVWRHNSRVGNSNFLEFNLTSPCILLNSLHLILMQLYTHSISFYFTV